MITAAYEGEHPLTPLSEGVFSTLSASQRNLYIDRAIRNGNFSVARALNEEEAKILFRQGSIVKLARHSLRRHGVVQYQRLAELEHVGHLSDDTATELGGLYSEIGQTLSTVLAMRRVIKDDRSNFDYERYTALTGVSTELTFLALLSKGGSLSPFIPLPALGDEDKSDLQGTARLNGIDLTVVDTPTQASEARLQIKTSDRFKSKSYIRSVTKISLQEISTMVPDGIYELPHAVVSDASGAGSNRDDEFVTAAKHELYKKINDNLHRR